MSKKTYMPEDIDSAATQQAVYNFVLYLPLDNMEIDDGMKISDIVIKAKDYAVKQQSWHRQAQFIQV